MSAFAHHQKPLLGTPLMRWHSLAYGLVGFWLMNEGAGRVLVNSVSRITSATLGTGGMWWRGHAVQYPGSAAPTLSWATVGYHASLRPTVLTVSSRVRLRATGAGQSLVRGCRFDDGSSGYGYVLYYDGADGVSGFIRAGGADVGALGQILPPVEAVFHEICFTYNGASIVPYVDGLRAGPGVSTSGAPTYNAPPSPLIFGQAATGTTVQPLAGEQAHVAIWNRALSAAEVLAFARDPYALFRWPGYRGFAPGPLGSPYFYQRYVLGHGGGAS